MTDRLIDDSRLARSTAIFAKCKEVVAGGESSYARLSNTRPIVMAGGEGAYFEDVDGNRYLDWCLGYGPMIFGHRPPAVIEAITRQIADHGMLYTFPHELDYEVGRKIVQAVPGVDQVRFANSGAEATQAAMRLARAFTGKEKILKWESGYHGFLDCHALSFEPAGTEAAPQTTRFKAGIPRVQEECIVTGTFNDLDGAERLVRDHRHELAAVISEPVLASCGVIPPEPGFLEGLRRICDDNEVLLIFDEVITGFRLALGGAQERYGVLADITTWGKAIGGGTPCAAAFGARREIMDLEARDEVFHGGTYNSNPMVLAGMDATLGLMIDQREAFFGHLETIADAMVAGMRAVFAAHGVPAQVQQAGPIWQVFFGLEGPVTRVRQAAENDALFYAHFQTECQARGIYFHNAWHERWFASAAHTQAEIDRSLAVFDEVTGIVKKRLAGAPRMPSH
jgi:glutamate-1-semialdehyde 2,1-aminomutase